MRIYVHVPFCLSKCYYCSFYSVGSLDKIPQYISALREEYLRRVAPLSGSAFGSAAAARSEAAESGAARVKSIYIGGGTPNVFDAGQLRSLLSIFREDAERGRNKYSDFEYTVELNPELVTEDRVRVLASFGVNRASLGVQSTSDAVLKSIGRRHLYSDVVNSAELLIKYGITNLSFDFITGFAGQTTADADEFAALADKYAKHISVYSLEYFGSKISQLDEDSERDLFEYLKSRLKSCGFNRYEISNFARSGFESRHNLAYWTGEKYVGIGPAAASYDGICRRTNVSDLNKYILAGGVCSVGGAYSSADARGASRGCDSSNDTEFAAASVVKLTEYDRMVEALTLPLRMSEGLDTADFRIRFGVELSALKSVRMMVEGGVLAFNSAGNRMFFTDRGFDISNSAYVSIIREIEKSMDSDFVN